MTYIRTYKRTKIAYFTTLTIKHNVSYEVVSTCFKIDSSVLLLEC